MHKKERKLPTQLYKLLLLITSPIWFPTIIGIGFITLAYSLLSAIVDMLILCERDD